MRVAIVQIVCPSYKCPLFEQLGKIPGIDLTLFVGTSGGRMHPHTADLDGIQHVMLQNYTYRLGFEFVWQGGAGRIPVAQFDTIVIPDGVLYLTNYWLLWCARRYKIPVGIYSHGFNYQRRASRLSGLVERWRRWVHRRADFIVVYSDEGRRHIIIHNGVAPGRVFVAPNTLDVEGIVARVEAQTPEDHEAVRQRYQLPPGQVLIVFPGRLEAEKNPAWLLHAVKTLRARGHAVTAVFIGAGREEQNLRALSRADSRGEPLARFLGTLPAREVDLILAASDIVGMPGMTGLAVVHAFACAKPYVTIQSNLHSPEFAYLADGVNGLVAKPHPQGFTEALETLVSDPLLRARMGANGREFALKELSMEKQVQGFLQAFAYASKLGATQRCES